VRQKTKVLKRLSKGLVVPKGLKPLKSNGGSSSEQS